MKSLDEMKKEVAELFTYDGDNLPFEVAPPYKRPTEGVFMFSGEPVLKCGDGFYPLAEGMGQTVHTWKELEELYFTSAYMACNENQSATARVTGASIQTVRKKLREYGLLDKESDNDVLI